MSKAADKIIGEILEHRYVVTDLLEVRPFGGRFAIYDMVQLQNLVMDINHDPDGEIKSYCTARARPPVALSSTPKSSPAPPPAPPPESPPELSPVSLSRDAGADKIEAAWFAMAQQEELYDPERHDYHEWQASLEDLAEQLPGELYSQFSLHITGQAAAIPIQNDFMVGQLLSAASGQSFLGPLLCALIMTGVMSLLLLVL